jgi:enediyne biosynthesis protein E4
MKRAISTIVPITVVVLNLSAPAASGDLRFKNATAESGFLSITGYGGHGIQVADIDGDGLLDVYVTHIFDPKQNRPDLLFRNHGGNPPRFEEIGLLAGVADDGFFPVTLEDGTVDNVSEESHAAIFADFDNDGDFDLFNAHTWSGHHRLYRNDGTGRFVDISDAAGIEVRDIGPRGVGAADLDGNGFLDVVLTAWQGAMPNVYMNQGGLRFERQRLQGDADPSFANQGLTIVDLNHDGKPDVALTAFEYVDGAGGVGPVAILEADSGRLVERTGFVGIQYERTTSDYRGTNGFSFQDIDNDGDLDLVITGYQGSKLYRNNGEGRFHFVERFDGIAYTAAFGDVDNDGDLDLYIAGSTGIYLNDGKGGFHFQDSIGLDGIGLDARSAVFADMDNDGDLDLLIASKQGPNTFFVNETTSAGSWLEVSLTAPNGEKGAIGAEVALYQGGHLGEPEALLGYRVVQSATGYCSQDPSRLHFGVAPTGTYDIRVTFKEGTVVTRTGLAPRQVVEIRGN